MLTAWAQAAGASTVSTELGYAAGRAARLARWSGEHSADAGGRAPARGHWHDQDTDPGPQRVHGKHCTQAERGMRQTAKSVQSLKNVCFSKWCNGAKYVITLIW